MAKKKNGNKPSAKKSSANTKPDESNQLPQNILPVGEREEENIKIYIHQSVYAQIHRFTADKTVNEAGGMLVGTIIEEFGKTNILIDGFIEAKHCQATPTTLTFTHETWERCHKEMDKKFPNQKIVGWIHTHPNFGIFLSEYDRFIQQNFFAEPYEVAYVVDPIQKSEGFYFWKGEQIQKSKGFFIYDKTGKKLDAPAFGARTEGEEKKSAVSSEGSHANTRMGILFLLVILLCVALFWTNNKLNRLQNELTELENKIGNSILYSGQTLVPQNREVYTYYVPATERIETESQTEPLPEGPEVSQAETVLVME